MHHQNFSKMDIMIIQYLKKIEKFRGVEVLRGADFYDFEAGHRFRTLTVFLIRIFVCGFVFSGYSALGLVSLGFFHAVQK